LSGRPFRAAARRLEGVDLSPRMVAIARSRGTYDDLAVQDLSERLVQVRDVHNLIIATDALVYFGDLAIVFRDAAAGLRPGGHFALTLEAQPEDGYRLNGSGRFSHGEGYIRRTAAAFGLSLVLLRKEPLRREYGRPIDAWVVVLRRR
jgi:predicted TPR repeat methyltransferase